MEMAVAVCYLIASSQLLRCTKLRFLNHFNSNDIKRRCLARCPRTEQMEHDGYQLSCGTCIQLLKGLDHVMKTNFFRKDNFAVVLIGHITKKFHHYFSQNEDLLYPHSLENVTSLNFEIVNQNIERFLFDTMF